ncbi:MAG TPA: hypothetical protein VEY92_11350 [Pseudoxanthomonas sp.]|nr:hypothetical protein [Pseudoxanthomonas sp.]
METEWIEVIDENRRRTRILALYPMIETRNQNGIGEERGTPIYRSLDGETLNKIGGKFIAQRSRRRFTPVA